MEFNNEMSLQFMAKSCNESFARVVISAFVAQVDPTIEMISDIKTAVSEAVTNAIIHGYENKEGTVYVKAKILSDVLEIMVEDKGKGILNIEKAREPLYTSSPELERSGMGFTVMETFMDSVDVISYPGEGTKVIMSKNLAS